MAFEKVTVTQLPHIGLIADPDPAPVFAPDPVRRAIPADARVTTWTAADDWPLRRFDWLAARPRGRLLFQTGRGDFFEKYLEAIAHFHGQGWSVTAFDWRGQGGSGRLSADSLVGHASDFGVFDADLADFWTDWRAEDPAAPTAILGHSMGGMMVMRALANRAIDPDAAILVAPMLGLKSPLGLRLSTRIARLLATRNPTRAAWKHNERPNTTASRQNLLTHDTARYLDERWWHENRPDLRLGPPSWGWLAEAFDGAGALAVDPRIASIAVPVLMLVADADKLVDPRAAIHIAQRLPDSRLIRFGRDSAHEILREADPVRTRAMTAMDTFLDERVPVATTAAASATA